MGSHRQLDSAAVPEQMYAMKALGFETQPTDDSRYAEWSGHGLNVTLPSDMKLTQDNAIKAVVGAAVKAGREQLRGEMRHLLGVRS